MLYVASRSLWSRRQYAHNLRTGRVVMQKVAGSTACHIVATQVPLCDIQAV